MNDGQALESLNPLQVAQVMRRVSGLSLEELADRMGRNKHSVACWFSEAQPEKFIPTASIPEFCHALGSPLLIEWLLARYEQLERGEPAASPVGNPRLTIDLLLRGIVQASNAVALLRDISAKPTPSERRQAAASILLAVSTLVAACQEIGSQAPVASGLRFFVDEPPAMAKPGWWRRLVGWWRGDSLRRANAERRELFAELQRGGTVPLRELEETRLIMGAMGHMLRKASQWVDGNDRATIHRLLRDGEKMVSPHKDQGCQSIQN